MQSSMQSSMHKSTVSRESVFKLDANGNIDADNLTKEMTDALAFDIDYKKKDNMKKRAIKSAPDYDAFRNMVACASLKTVRSVMHLLYISSWFSSLHAELSITNGSLIRIPKYIVARKLKVLVIRRRVGRRLWMEKVHQGGLIPFLDRKHWRKQGGLEPAPCPQTR